MTRRIDAHQHYWQLSKPFDYQWLATPGLEKIDRDYLPEDLAPHLASAGIDHTVFVQTQHDLEENRWVLSLTERHEWIAGVVGWVDLASESCEDQVLEFKEHPKFVGVRHITQDEPDDRFILSEPVLRGLAVLQRHQVPFDLLFYVKHLPHAAELGRKFPDLPMVIDHLAKPRIKDRAIEDWLPHLQEASRCDNIYCKLSGMVTEADWSHWKPQDLKPYVDAAVELFGPERCMFGSDWPVCELAASYGQVHDALVSVLGEISSDESERIFGGTAAAFYQLPI